MTMAHRKEDREKGEGGRSPSPPPLPLTSSSEEEGGPETIDPEEKGRGGNGFIHTFRD